MTSLSRSARYCRLCVHRLPPAFAKATIRPITSITSRSSRVTASNLPKRRLPTIPFQSRGYALKSQAEQAMEDIEHLYEAAREEFQIAAEETEDNTIYAADDRAAARAEFDKLQQAFTVIVDGPGYAPDTKEDIRRRAGQRIRELETALGALEEKAMNQD